MVAIKMQDGTTRIQASWKELTAAGVFSAAVLASAASNYANRYATNLPVVASLQASEQAHDRQIGEILEFMRQTNQEHVEFRQQLDKQEQELVDHEHKISDIQERMDATPYTAPRATMPRRGFQYPK